MFSPNQSGRGDSGHVATTSWDRHTERSTTPAPIELCVSDLARSRKFFSDLLGFVPAEGYGYSDRRVVLVSPLLAQGYRCIVLTRDRRRGYATGLLLELETTTELLDRYILARLLGATTSPLVSRGRTLVVSILNPDGHKIELRTSPHPRSELSADVSAQGSTARWGRGLSDLRMPARFGREPQERPSREEPAPDDSLAWFDALCGQEPTGVRTD